MVSLVSGPLHHGAGQILRLNLPGSMNCEISVHPLIIKSSRPLACATANPIAWIVMPMERTSG